MNCELKWLEGNSGQTTDELIAPEGEYRTDSLFLAFEQALDQKAACVGFGGLTEAERVILVIEAIEHEVNNGGYNQLFINSSKEYASSFVADLDHIGCTRVAELTQQAINILGIEGPITIEAIDSVMQTENEQRVENLGECYDQYSKLAGDLAGPLFEFIKSKRDQITLKD